MSAFNVYQYQGYQTFEYSVVRKFRYSIVEYTTIDHGRIFDHRTGSIVEQFDRLNISIFDDGLIFNEVHWLDVWWFDWSNIVRVRNGSIFDKVRYSNIEYQISNHWIMNIEPSILILISNIEPFQVLQLFDPSNHGISNIEHRTFLNQRKFDRSNDWISNIELRIRILIEWFGNSNHARYDCTLTLLGACESF